MRVHAERKCSLTTTPLLVLPPAFKDFAAPSMGVPRPHKKVGLLAGGSHPSTSSPYETKRLTRMSSKHKDSVVGIKSPI